MKFEGIKHVSLDAWNTVLIPNEKYAEMRTKLLADTFCCSLDFAKKVYTNVKREADQKASQHGQAVFCDHLYENLISNFPRVRAEPDPKKIRECFEWLFESFQPTILKETCDEIKRLHQKGITISITSNTNFISGEVLAPFISKKIPEISFMLFSDLQLPLFTPIGCDHRDRRDGYSPNLLHVAKPHASFFDAMHSYANMARNETLEKSEILHIGDNRICDFSGATNAGYSSQLIDNASQLPAAIKEL